MTILDIVEKTYALWGEAVSKKVGDNYSMEDSTTIASLPYATLMFLGLPTNSSDLEGAECSVVPTVQVSVYTKGQRALTQVYEIDAVSHETLTGLGYRRIYGPEPTDATDPSIKRLLSRYSRVIGYGDKFSE